MKISPFLISLALLAVACTSSVETAEEPEVISLELNEGTNMAAALSPDGQTFAIDLVGRIWLLPVEGGEAVPITDSLGNARQPSWSPDGQHISFQAYWKGNWHIYVVNKDGSGLQQMTTGEFDHREPHWSPDGSSLLFSSDKSGNYDIWSRDLVGEQMTALTTAQGNDYAPAWSPDGTQFAYYSDERDASGIYVQSLESGERRKLLATNNKITGIAWGPTGEELIYNELLEAGAQMVRINLNDSEDGEVLTGEEEDAFPFRPSWSPDGKGFYTADGKIKSFGAPGATSEIPFSAKIFMQRPAYERKKRDFDETSDNPVKGIVWPVLSPDGQQVAFTALQDLWLRNADGSLDQLTDDPYIQIAADWSPDGSRLAYCSDKDGPFGIWVMDLESRTEEKLLETGSSPSGLKWSPDGQFIAYTISLGPPGGMLFKVEVSTGVSQPVGRKVPSSVGTPAWSPDGKTIALSVLDKYSTLYREGVNRVTLFSTDGKPQRSQKAPEHWSFGVRGNDGPIWSPDGKYMAAATRGNIWICEVDENGDVVSFPERITQELSDAPSWSGDSKKILFMATDRLKMVDIETKEVTDVPVDLTWKRSLPSGSKIIHVGGLIDGNSEVIQENVDVVIHGHRIVEIAPHDEAREADVKIDASDAFLIPGLIDLHTHEGSTFGERLGRAWLAWGVTTVRNPSADPYDELNRREAIQSGRAIGPRLYFTGSPIDGSRIYYGGAIALQSEEQIDLELNRARALDYDLIKTYVRLPDPLQQQVVEGAHAIGIPVTSHELYPAVTYNTDGTEHLSGTSRIGYSSKISRTWQSYDDVTDMLAKSGMSFTPTTAIIAYKHLIGKDELLPDDPRSKAFANMTGNGIPGFLDPSFTPEESNEKLYRNLLRMVTDVHRKGGFVVAGTDSPIIPYGYALHMELGTYQEAGLTPFEVLQTATVNNARALNATSDLGSVEVGKIADLVIVEANPLEDINNLRQIRTVIKNGEVYNMDQLLQAP